MAGATAIVFVWALQRLLHIPDPHFARMILAGVVGGIVGVLGRMFIDEVAQQ